MSKLDPALIAALAATAVTAVLGYLGWRRSVKQDNVAAEAGIATFEAGSVQSALLGMEKLIGGLERSLERTQARVDALEAEVASLKEQLRLANMAE